MSSIAAKFDGVIDEGIAHLETRASNVRGVDRSSIIRRVRSCLEKYLFTEGASPQHSDIKIFIDELHADDLCLILACESGDETAWADLVTNFDTTVKSAARKITSNTEDAEDLASSIWAELYGLRVDADGNKKSKLAYYSGRGSLGGWLRAVVSQLAVDQHRKVSKLVQIEEDRDFENIASEIGFVTSGGLITQHEDPETEMARESSQADLSKALALAIGSLADEDRLILKLYYFDDLKLKEIAAMFGYHEATASRRLTRLQSEVRKSVERILKDDHGWSETEVKYYLSETAAGLGINLETMFAVMTMCFLVQELWGKGVL